MRSRRSTTKNSPPSGCTASVLPSGPKASSETLLGRSAALPADSAALSDGSGALSDGSEALSDGSEALSEGSKVPSICSETL
uniref:hypothetical protein n=1 Tax=Nonomuraea fuscirosea TaxID=1291556 RepID=UPI00389AB700